MTFEAKTWVDGETPNADDVNRWEQGISDAAQGSDSTVAGFINDNGSSSYAAVESAVDAHLGGDATGLVTAVAGKVAKGSIVVNLADYATFADALTAAAGATGSATLSVPPGTYDVSSQPTIPANVTVRGEGAASILKPSSAVTRVLSLAGRMENLKVDAAGFATSSVVSIKGDGASLDRVEIADTVTALYGVENIGSYNDLTITGCTLHDVKTAIDVRGPADRAKIIDCTIYNWQQRGIWFTATADGGSTKSVVRGNEIRDMIAGGTVRYPIRYESTTAGRHSDATMNENIVTGPGTSYNDATTPGTADQISVSSCDGATLIGNVSTGGGDGAMTVAVASKVTVTGNRLEYADSAGLYIGASVGTMEAATVAGNLFYNCGQNRNGDRSDARAGIRATITSSGISGNAFMDDQTTPTMLYGVSMTNCSNVELGSNANHGVATLYYNESGNTGISVVQTAAL